MNKLRCFALMLAGALAASPLVSQAAGYPDKPIEMIAAGSAGGGLDLTARAMETALREAKLFPETFVIKNVGGAGGNVARAQVHQKKGDGHVLYVESNRIYVNRIVGTTPLTHNDVTPIGRLITEYVAWVVRADSPYKSPKDILDLLKKNPEAVTFGVGTVPSNDQMNILRPVMASGIDPKKIKVVSFKSGGDLMIQLLGGHVPVISTGLSEAIEQVKAGKARVIAVSAPNALPGDLAKVPTWRSLGIDVSILHWRGVFAPPGISKEVIAYWDKALGQMAKSEAWKKQLEKHGWFDAYADSATFKKDLDAEEKVYTEILTDLGMAKGLKK
ncbi:MAG: tripartite tricarboxylate transporter substrate binding protein [Burkholderiales bacterium]|jgi:putative tricarboxylic transport membrane protein|nr:tripartite tricarboxylate transporter substrate binding protein [Burkholderiales bacterium]